MRIPFSTFTALFVLTCVNSSARAEDPWNIGILSSINLGTRFSSILELRGATFYDHLQFDPVIGIFMFDDRFEFLGDSVGYRDFISGRWLRARTKFNRISDKPLFPRSSSLIGVRNTRRDSIEWSSSLEFFLPAYDDTYSQEIDLNFSQDLEAHHGQYFEIKSKTKIIDFKAPLLDVKVEPNFVASLGWGSSEHNGYFYGNNEAVSGFNNIAYGIQFAFPETADRNYPIILIEGYSVLNAQRKGNLLLDKADGVLIQFIATFGVYGHHSSL